METASWKISEVWEYALWMVNLISICSYARPPQPCQIQWLGPLKSAETIGVPEGTIQYIFWGIP